MLCAALSGVLNGAGNGVLGIALNYEHTSTFKIIVKVFRL